MTRILSLLAATCCLLAGCAAGMAPGSPGPAAAGQVPMPLVDHHKHLMGPAILAIADGEPPLPAVALPDDLAALLRERSERWNDASRLRELLEADSMTLGEERRGWLRGRDAVAGFLSTRFARPYSLTPVDFLQRGDSAQVSGYYTRGEGAARQYVGYFFLTARRGGDGRWRITGEVPRFPVPAARQGTIAEQLVAQLDAAGIDRAVVLSEGFWADGPILPVADPYPVVRAENDWTARQAERFPDRLIAFCSFNPVAAHALAELERCAADRAFRGFKFSFAMSAVDLKNADHVARLRAVFAAANRHRLPIVAHLRGGSDYGAEHVEIFLSQVMAAAPDITVQVAHLWGGEQYSPTALAALAEAVEAGRPEARNLYFDVAEIVAEISQTGDVATQAELARRIRQIGLDRILFGSDGAHPLQSWRWLRANVPLTDAEFTAIARNVAPYLREGPAAPE